MDKTESALKFEQLIDCITEDESEVSKKQLQELYSQAMNVHRLGLAKLIPAEKMIKCLTMLESKIRDGARISSISDPDDTEDERKLFFGLAMERIMTAVDASLTALYILTAPDLEKQVYLEDVIDGIIMYTKFQLQNTIYPACDPASKNDSSKAKRRKLTRKEGIKSVSALSTKLTEVVSLLAELMNSLKLTDNTVLHASSMSITPFFVEKISDLQLPSLKLATTIFSKYEKHRKLILDDILESIGSSSTKIRFHTYELNSEEKIQMVSALVVQTIQCILPKPDILFNKNATTAALYFLHEFLTKSTKKSEGADIRQLFENFIQDLITTAKKPEWPAAQLMLNILGNLLVKNITNKSLEVSLKILNLDFLGTVIAGLRKDDPRFETYLKYILSVLSDKSVNVRAKAMKCLTSIVEVDPSVLKMKEVELAVSYSFLDQSISVREAAVDYNILSARILDTGVSVRKRVIKILKEICIECPNYEKIPEICFKIIRRVNDEGSISKLVLEFFQKMWFTPVDKEKLSQKVVNIMSIVSGFDSLEWIEKLLLGLFRPPEDKKDKTDKSIECACQQIVDGLVSNLDDSKELSLSMQMLHIFAKIRPQLLFHHALILQRYLSFKCQTQKDYQIICSAIKMLELIIPSIENHGETFFSLLEKDSVDLMKQHDPQVISSCISCLRSVVNVTKNFSLIQDCFGYYYGFLIDYKRMITQNQNELKIMNPMFKRSIFVVGLLLRFFDFTKKEVTGNKLPQTIKDNVFNTLVNFLKNNIEPYYTLKAIGSICIRHPELMIKSELQNLYQTHLKQENITMKIQVLSNIESYLQEEMNSEVRDWSNCNLKEMEDVKSGMASTIIQIYLKETLEASLHDKLEVRNASFKVIQQILTQGLVHPVQIIPFLISLSTDSEKQIRICAEKHLDDIFKRYPSFVHMMVKSGIEKSYELQTVQQSTVRGFQIRDGKHVALNGFLYSILKTQQQKRAFLLSILKQFEDKKTTLAQLLYLADNIAYFPYQIHDEPLFIIHHINMITSVTGTSLLKSFHDALIEPDGNEDIEENDDERTLLSRIPYDTTELQDCLKESQSCILLLVLRQHLMASYGLKNGKVMEYSPTDKSKAYKTTINMKSNSEFNPKSAIETLEGNNITHCENYKEKILNEYLEFKTLMNIL